MDILSFQLALALAAHGPGNPAIGQWRSEIAQASRRFGVPASWIEKVMEAESGGRITIGGVPTTSRAGAMGLMQLMPATWHQLAERYRLGSNPHDPSANILAGAAYLREMHDLYGYPGLFAAYHAGPGRYASHLQQGTPLPDETVSYLARITGEREPASRSRSAAERPAGNHRDLAGAPIFITLSRDQPSPSAGAQRRPGPGPS